jgi:hypothetical protein
MGLQFWYERLVFKVDTIFKTVIMQQILIGIFPSADFPWEVSKRMREDARIQILKKKAHF